MKKNLGSLDSHTMVVERRIASVVIQESGAIASAPPLLKLFGNGVLLIIMEEAAWNRLIPHFYCMTCTFQGC